MNTLAVAILGYVTVERLAELVLARSNTKRLLRKGATEHAAAHYPLIVAVHTLWLVSLWFLASARPPDMFWLAMYVILQAARFWVLGTLGPRWTTRIITLPGEDLVREGPYRFLNHPNYWVVIGEIAVLPLVFGLPWVALIFSILNGAVLTIRVREENRALGASRVS